MPAACVYVACMDATCSRGHQNGQDQFESMIRHVCPSFCVADHVVNSCLLRHARHTCTIFHLRVLDEISQSASDISRVLSSCSRTARARADAPASVCRPCTPHARTPLAQDGRQVHTCRAESALDGHSGFAHAVIMSVQTQSCGKCGIHAPLHGCTALPPGSVHAVIGKSCLQGENISPREYLISTRSRVA